MTLGELIKRLEKADQDQVCPWGWHNPHSYRGYYDQLAFEPKENVEVREMLACAKKALGTTYEGWKGGEFKMEEYTDVWIAEQGRCGDQISHMLLNYMLGEETA
jgi:hypothetical protein